MPVGLGVGFGLHFRGVVISRAAVTRDGRDRLVVTLLGRRNRLFNARLRLRRELGEKTREDVHVPGRRRLDPLHGVVVAGHGRFPGRGAVRQSRKSGETECYRRE